MNQRIEMTAFMHFVNADFPIKLWLIHSKSFSISIIMIVIVLFYAGVMSGVENMTVQDGGQLIINVMVDKYLQIIDTINFNTILLKTGGFASIKNAFDVRILNGKILTVSSDLLTSFEMSHFYFYCVSWHKYVAILHAARDFPYGVMDSAFISRFLGICE